MMATEFLNLFDRHRKSGRGWVARCPAHKDRSPSLNIREGDTGILVRCWAGCSLEEICKALGVQVKDLFYEQPYRKERKCQARTKIRQREAVNKLRATQADTLREADSVIQAATGVDISKWSDEQLDKAMAAVCEARRLLTEEERKLWMTA